MEPLQEHLRDVNKYCTILAMGTTFIARGPRVNERALDTSAARHAVNRRGRGLVSASLWIACAALAPLGAWAEPPRATAPEPAPTPAAVSDVNATSPRADLTSSCVATFF